MARLKYSHTGENRSVHLGLRLTPGEGDELRRRAAEIGISRAEFVRRQALGQALPKRRPEVSRLLFAALAAIGNNVNQLARAANTDGFAQIERQADATLIELRETIGKLVDRE